MLSAVPSSPGAPALLNHQESQSVSSGSKRGNSSDSEEPTSKKSKSDRSDIDDSNDKSDAEDADAVPIDSQSQLINDIHSSKAFLLTVGKDDCILSVSNSRSYIDKYPKFATVYSSRSRSFFILSTVA